MNFPEDVPNSSQNFMSFVDQVYCFFKTCTYSLFIYTLSIKLFVPSAISIFPIFCNLNWILNKASTLDSNLLVYALLLFYFIFCILFLGENRFVHYSGKVLIFGTLIGNDTNIKFSSHVHSLNNSIHIHHSNIQRIHSLCIRLKIEAQR